MRKRIRYESIEPPAYETIIAARSGDPYALSVLLRHYDAYISELSKRKRKTKHGKTVDDIDPALKAVLQEKLTKATLNWKELI